MPDEVLTIKEVAALLRLVEQADHAMARAGEPPVFKTHGPWRIWRTELERWTDEQPRGGGDGEA